MDPEFRRRATSKFTSDCFTSRCLGDMTAENGRLPTCKADALPAELHAHRNCMILIDSARENPQMSTCYSSRCSRKLISAPVMRMLSRLRYLQRFPQQLREAFRFISEFLDLADNTQ